MRLKINGVDCGFNIKKAPELLLINTRKEQGYFDDDLTSENYSLPLFRAKAAKREVELFGQFTDIDSFETAIHKLFNLTSITTGLKVFNFVTESTTALNLSFYGFVDDGIQVKSTKKGGVISAIITMRIITTAS